MLTIVATDPTTDSLDTLVVPVCQDRDIHNLPAVRRLIRQARRVKRFSAEKDDCLVIDHPGGFAVNAAVFVGLGPFDRLDGDALRRAAARGVQAAIDAKAESAAVAVPAGAKLDLPVETVVEAIGEGACLANHVFDAYRREPSRSALEHVALLAPAGVARRTARLAARVDRVCAGTRLAREWVSTPSNDKYPERLAARLREAAESAGITVSTLDADQLREEGFGAMLAVAQGSTHAPRLVVFDYRPAGRKAPTVALVGKGVTFDSGGINLKSTGHVEDMKSDMAGAAAVAAAVITAARLKLKVRVIGAMPLVENMPSGSAYRPGDVLRAFTGKTVEIGNTDAEGRLILVDTLAWVADRYAPAAMVDLATLTGACVVALGEGYAGLFTRNDELAGELLDAAARTGERCWRLPMPDDYMELLKSEIADIRNVGSKRWAGASTAALFLNEFVGDTPWVHLDIAGPAFQSKAGDLGPAGGTGFGVRLLCDWLAGWQ